MDSTSVYDLISRTLGDQLHGSAIFEASNGELLRVDLAIDEQWFRAVFQDSAGHILVVTPGNVIAQDGQQVTQIAGVDTQSALDAWKSQPPITLAPISAGLSQLTTSNDRVNQIIAAITQLSGTLAFAFIPTLCWFNASYPQLSLGKLVLNDVIGRVCFRDIVFKSEHVAFSIELFAKCNHFNLALGASQNDNNLPRDFILLESQTPAEREVELNINASAYLNFIEQRIEAKIIYAQVLGTKGHISYGSLPDPWKISLTEGLQLTVENLLQDYGFQQPQANGSLRGHVTLHIPTAKVEKKVLDLDSGGRIIMRDPLLDPAVLTNTSLSLNLDSKIGRDDLTRGYLTPCQLKLNVNYETPSLSLKALQGTFALADVTFDRNWIDAQLQIIGAIADSVDMTLGDDADKLQLISVIFDLSAHFQNQRQPAGNLLHVHQLQVTAKEGELNLVLKLVNDGNEPLKLKLEPPEAQDERAVDIFAQDLLVVTGADARRTAKRIEARIRRTKTLAPIRKLQLLEWYVLTPASFDRLRQRDAAGNQLVPEQVLRKFEDQLRNKPFETKNKLLQELRDLLRQYVLTTASFERLRQRDGTGNQFVPEEVIRRFEDQLRDILFDKLDNLFEALRKLLTDQEFQDYHNKIAEAAEHKEQEFQEYGNKIAEAAEYKETILKDASSILQGLFYQGSLLVTTPPNSELYGSIMAPLARVNFTQIEGVEIEKLNNFTGIRPGDWFELTVASFARLRQRDENNNQLVPEEVLRKFEGQLRDKRFDKLDYLLEALRAQELTTQEILDYGGKITSAAEYKRADSFEARDLHIILPILPESKPTVGAAGLMQQFQTVDVVLGSSTIKIPPPQKGKNLVRFTYASNLSGRQILTAQLSVPKATIKLPNNTPDIQLENIEIGWHNEALTQQLSENLRSLLSQTHIRFKVIAKLFPIPLVNETVFSPDKEILNLLVKLIREKIGISVSDEIYNLVLKALLFPEKVFLEDILGLFGVSININLIVKIPSVTTEVYEPKSDQTHIAIAIKTRLPEFGVRATIEWKVFDFEKFEFVTKNKTVEKLQPFVDVEVSFIVRFSIKFDPIGRRVELEGIELYIIPPLTNSEPILITDTEYHQIIKDLAQYPTIEDTIFNRIRERLKYTLPDNWDISQARFEFDRYEKAVSINLDASEKAWNSFKI